MTTRLTTGTAAKTTTLEDGEEVFPCRCGDTHRGPWAIYDYLHHNCYHEEPLVDIGGEIGISYWACPICGKTWRVEGKA